MLATPLADANFPHSCPMPDGAVVQRRVWLRLLDSGAPANEIWGMLGACLAPTDRLALRQCLATSSWRSVLPREAVRPPRRARSGDGGVACLSHPAFGRTMAVLPPH
jgi:hypothetical protein